jgi:hypothetical protein
MKTKTQKRYKKYTKNIQKNNRKKYTKKRLRGGVNYSLNKLKQIKERFSKKEKTEIEKRAEGKKDDTENLQSGVDMVNAVGTKNIANTASDPTKVNSAISMMPGNVKNYLTKASSGIKNAVNVVGKSASNAASSVKYIAPNSEVIKTVASSIDPNVAAIAVHALSGVLVVSGVGIPIAIGLQVLLYVCTEMANSATLNAKLANVLEDVITIIVENNKLNGLINFSLAFVEDEVYAPQEKKNRKYVIDDTIFEKLIHNMEDLFKRIISVCPDDCYDKLFNPTTGALLAELMQLEEETENVDKNKDRETIETNKTVDSMTQVFIEIITKENKKRYGKDNKQGWFTKIRRKYFTFEQYEKVLLDISYKLSVCNGLFMILKTQYDFLMDYYENTFTRDDWRAIWFDIQQEKEYKRIFENKIFETVAKGAINKLEEIPEELENTKRIKI